MLRRVERKRLMQQQIGFCSTADGVRIAYATVGTGPALVVVPAAPCHLGLEWEEPRVRDFWETIGRHHLVVRYDKHGCGLSDRNRTDFSLDSEIRTIEAIVKGLGLKSFVLWGQGGMGAAAAIAYAVKSPDGVSRLILSNAQARWHGVPAWGGAGQETFRALLLSNQRMFSLSLTETMLGSSLDAASQQWLIRRVQEGTTPEILEQLIVAQLFNMDVRDLLPKVRVPTLVVHYRNDRAIPFEAGRELAAGIPGARFVPLEGDAHYFYFGDTQPLRRAIAEFLGDPIEEVRQPHPDSSKFSSAPEAVPGIFSKEGEFWTIACRGKVFRLKGVRGLAYIAYLLGHPGEEFHVLSLASKTGADELAEPATEEQATQSDLTVGRMGDAGEMLDAQAKAAYKRRTAELREQLDEARELNQLELVDRLEDEIETLGRELSRAVGLGGRDRRAASAAERARINVTRAIKIALERIAEHNPALAALLTSSIRTGMFCSYTADARLPASAALAPWFARI
jgi:pimeloyl-ACP methyl ester carboxylesterase